MHPKAWNGMNVPFARRGTGTGDANKAVDRRGGGVCPDENARIRRRRRGRAHRAEISFHPHVYNTPWPSYPLKPKAPEPEVSS